MTDARTTDGPMADGASTPLSADEREAVLVDMTARALRLVREASELAFTAIAFVGDARMPRRPAAGAPLPAGLTVGPDGLLTQAPDGTAAPGRSRGTPAVFHARRTAADGGPAVPAESSRATPDEPAAAPSPSAQ